MNTPLKPVKASTWPECAAGPLLLQSGEVHVWSIDLEVPAAVERQLATTLDRHEIDRAMQFHRSEHRRRFIVSHGALRGLLGELVGLKPDQIRFGHVPYGKPYLARCHPIAFNMSHSHNCALVAVSLEGPLGIDIERVRPLPDLEAISGRFFSTTEVRHLHSVAGTALEARCFFNCWTRKEALIKGLSMGLQLPLNQFSVSLLPDEAAAVTEDKTTQGILAGWHLRELYHGHDFAAALATPYVPMAVRCWSWRW